MKLDFPAIKKDGSEPMDPIVVIGNGMAGHRFCRTFRAMDHSTPIIIIGKESDPAYDRVNLAKRVTLPERDALYLDDTTWYEKHNIHLLLDTSVTAVDIHTNTITTSVGETIAYGKLVIATGSIPWKPTVPGIDGKNIFVYRTISDIDTIRSAAENSRTAVVIGGGLLGLEAADTLKQLGMRVHVLEIADYLMPQQLDPDGGIQLREEIANNGIFVHTRCQTVAIADLHGKKAVILADGSDIECDFVVISAGIRPATHWLGEADIKRNPVGAITVDNHLGTNHPHVYAIGECAAFEGTVFGLVAPGYQMADALAGS